MNRVAIAIVIIVLSMLHRQLVVALIVVVVVVVASVTDLISHSVANESTSRRGSH